MSSDDTPEDSYRYFKERFKGAQTTEESWGLIRDRNDESEHNWNEQATKALRDLAVDSGIPLSSIARAAKGEIYYKLRVPDRYIKEYKKWRQIYMVYRRLGKSLR